MPRMSRILNITITPADAWQKVFDTTDYKLNRVREIRLKQRESNTADHFRYKYSDSAAHSEAYLTSTTGVITVRDAAQIWVWIPTVDSQIIEIELIYK